MRGYTQHRNFEQELFSEIKYHNHCKKIDQDPKHFCTQTELAKNLGMSARDVGPNLRKLVEKGLLLHDRVVINGITKDKFTPVDKRLFDSEKLIQMMTNRIEERFEMLRLFAKDMKKTPPLYNIKKTEDGTTGKINKRGMAHLDQFCDTVKEILSYVESMSYSMFSDSIKRTPENYKAIDKTREDCLNEIEKILKFIFEGFSDLRKKVILDNIAMKIPTYFMLLQIKKQAKLKI